MKELETRISFEDEKGNNFEMILLKEFNYKKNKYAILMEIDEHEDNCSCDKNIGIFEVSKDKDNNDIFSTIEDEKLFDEVVEEAEKKLYE